MQICRLPVPLLSVTTGRVAIRLAFYRIPVVIKGQGEATERKSERCRRLWLAAINRADVDEKTCNKLRVCSDHFISGARNKYDETNPDWVPNKNLGYDVKSPTKSAIRHERLQNRKQTIKMNEAAISLLELSASVSEPPCAEEVDGVDSTEATDTELTDAEMLEFANERISELEFENARLKEQNECLQNIVHKMKANLPEDFEDDNDKVKYYTGLPSFTILMALFNLLAPDMHENGNSSLNKFQKIILTLMRLRLNLPITDLSYRFGVSRTTVSKVFLDTLHLMHDIMGPLVRWPDRDELYETMPMVFRKHFGKQVTCIIDCFEIFIDRPSNLTARAQTWSSYKHHNTAKYLIAITPQGSVSYISKGWGGRTSDKFLTAHSNFLDNLSHGDVILADRGFDIKELVALVGAEVKYPAFMRRKANVWTRGRKEQGKLPMFAYMLKGLLEQSGRSS
ncbi:uncharacterized protein LOC124268010 [Haliotis rubra]|uniref:uncharacterized protein LOC124268010 n=1 Tax=Haliotis rubra TaxID=36100 RepID=UPI001EE5A79C|nr:uncharacterized protein LOC124268010 [Haliotis rubra]